MLTKPLPSPHQLIFSSENLFRGSPLPTGKSQTSQLATGGSLSSGVGPALPGGAHPPHLSSPLSLPHPSVPMPNCQQVAEKSCCCPACPPVLLPDTTGISCLRPAAPRSLLSPHPLSAELQLHTPLAMASRSLHACASPRMFLPLRLPDSHPACSAPGSGPEEARLLLLLQAEGPPPLCSTFPAASGLSCSSIQCRGFV